MARSRSPAADANCWSGRKCAPPIWKAGRGWMRLQIIPWRGNRTMFDLSFDPGPFLLVTVVLGGSAAFIAGRAVAQTWRPWWQGVAYMLILGAAVRFIH